MKNEIAEEKNINTAKESRKIGLASKALEDFLPVSGSKNAGAFYVRLNPSVQAHKSRL
jgi:hypothetical protein